MMIILFRDRSKSLTTWWQLLFLFLLINRLNWFFAMWLDMSSLLKFLSLRLVCLTFLEWSKMFPLWFLIVCVDCFMPIQTVTLQLPVTKYVLFRKLLPGLVPTEITPPILLLFWICSKTEPVVGLNSSSSSMLPLFFSALLFWALEVLPLVSSELFSCSLALSSACCRLKDRGWKTKDGWTEAWSRNKKQDCSTWQ